MNIDKITINNITVFDDFELNLCDGINIIIGENGTGKTHLLKYIYALSEFIRKKHEGSAKIARDFFKTKSVNMVRNKDEKSKINIIYDETTELDYILFKEDNCEVYDEDVSYNDILSLKNIFIPAKEMLSHSKGFLALNNKYDLPFDRTYIDIITNAELPETKEVSDINQKILDKLSKVIDGKVIYENDTFYIVKKNNMKVEFSLEAEGLRKFGLLYKLIRNGLIERDTILLWDEPEANINPELMPLLVEILLELQEEGIQIFIATHSYNLAKYFELKRKDKHKVMFHSLYKTDNGVKSKSNEYFGELQYNSILEADSKLLDDVIEESFED